MAQDLIDLIDKAISDMEVYKHPEIEDCIYKLVEILTAGKNYNTDIGNDRIEYLGWVGDELHIRTSYYVRGCEYGDEYIIPRAVLEAEDPVAAMKTYYHKEKVLDTKSEVAAAKNNLNWYLQDLEKLGERDKSYRPDWSKVYKGYVHTPADDQELLLVTRESLRLAVSCIEQIMKEDYHPVCGAAYSEIMNVLGDGKNEI